MDIATDGDIAIVVYLQKQSDTAIQSGFTSQVAMLTYIQVPVV